MNKNKEKDSPITDKTWSQGIKCYYKCRKCKKWFLLENFNLKKRLCNRCLQKLTK